VGGMIGLASRRIEGSSTKKVKEAPRFLTARVAELFEKHHLPLTKTENGVLCSVLSILSGEAGTTVKNWVDRYLPRPARH